MKSNHKSPLHTFTKCLFPLLIFIGFSCYAEDFFGGLSEKEYASDEAAYEQLINRDFYIYLSDYKLCCDRGGKICMAKKAELQVIDESLPLNPKAQAHALQNMDEMSLKVTVFECPNPQTWLRIIQEKEGERANNLVRIYRFTEYERLLFKVKETDVKPVKVDELTQTFCTLEPFPAGPAPLPAEPSNTPINFEAAELAAAVAQTAAPTTEPAKTPHKKQKKAKPADPNALYIFGAYFYPQSASGPSKRRFRTADRTQRLKIEFSQDDKSRLLQELKSMFAQDPFKVTYCENKNIVAEAQQGKYYVYILSPIATTVLTRPSGFPAKAADMQQFCNFNALAFR